MFDENNNEYKRELILDTETTGFNKYGGDRIIEIAILEMVNKALTGRKFHTYLNPDKQSHPKALEKHGLTSQFLSQHPRFEDIADELISFIGDSQIIAHKALFDLDFINSELERMNRPIIYFNYVCTLEVFKKRYGKMISLSDLCQMYNISVDSQRLHGAIYDCQLLAKLYSQVCY